MLTALLLSLSLLKPPTACTDARYHALNFWLGKWDIWENGKVAGHYNISAHIEGCSLVAEWSGVQGDRGLGVFAFDAKSGKWRQMWTMNQFFGPPSPITRTTDPTYHGPGVRLVRDGADGGRTDRLTLLTVAGVPHQVLETSTDGKTWHTVFDAEHRKARR